jgi:hypothetical protein
LISVCDTEALYTVAVIGPGPMAPLNVAAGAIGARHELDEMALDRIASRVDLPDVATQALVFDLGIRDVTRLLR